MNSYFADRFYGLADRFYGRVERRDKKYDSVCEAY